MSLRKMYHKRTSLEYQLNDCKLNSPQKKEQIKHLESEITRMNNKIKLEKTLYPIRMGVGISILVFILAYYLVRGL